MVMAIQHLLVSGDKFGESSKWEQVVLIEIENVVRKKRGLHILLTLKINVFYLHL